ncbi:MAG: hypothetical protein QNJ72_23055 [Pleurocapsa sp. MO_226.B13]|nr:hypothetical protein [Pleurocapsa sp. MO_226.B13]
MFTRKVRKVSALKHPYSNALHTLLSQNKQGLLAREIASVLRISEKECEKLLYKEQLLGTLDVDPYSGRLIYRSKKSFSDNSLDTEIEIARKRHFVSKFCSMKIFFFPLTLSAAFLSIEIFSLHINFADKLSSQERSIQVDVDSNRTAIQFGDARGEKEELIKIKKILKNDSRNSCSVLWEQGDKCYVRNRLYSEREFDKELKRIDTRIQSIE